MHNLFYFDKNRHMSELSLQSRNDSVYGFLESQSKQRSGQLQFESKDYIKKLMSNSKRCLPRSLLEWVSKT